MNKNSRVQERKTKHGIGSAIQHTIQNTLTKKHFLSGDVSNKIPIHLSDGKTIVFAKSQDVVKEVTKFWEEKLKML